MNQRSYPGQLSTLRKRAGKKLSHRIKRRREKAALRKEVAR